MTLLMLLIFFGPPVAVHHLHQAKEYNPSLLAETKNYGRPQNDESTKNQIAARKTAVQFVLYDP